MAQTNKARPAAPKPRTHEGAVAMREGPLAALQRVLNAHMLWEDTFYIDGATAADHLTNAVHRAVGKDAAQTALLIHAARREMNIRHASLLAAVVYAKAGGTHARPLITSVIQRADEMAEVISMAGGKRMPHAVRKGVADAFAKFDEYQLGKYQGKTREFTLRDAVFLTHPDPAKVPLVQKIVDGTLETPDTWETNLSAGADTKETFERLLSTNKLGAMALLRNLRNMYEADVDVNLIAMAMERADWSRVLPFRFMSAVKHAPSYARLLDVAFKRAVEGSVYLKGSTAVLVDTSASMNNVISAKSTVQAVHAGAALAAAINGDHVDLYEWADTTRKVPNFGGLGAALSLGTGHVGHGTRAGQAVRFALSDRTYDRVILISDMQFFEERGRGGYGRVEVPSLPAGVKGYTINMRPYESAGLVHGDWTHFTGFSEHVLKYIAGEEKAA